MIIIDVTKEKSIDSALKKFRNKFNQYGVKKELLEKKEFEKKSVRKRNQKTKAKYIQHLRDKEQDV
jgi:small subunit ribosomal protein S21